MAQEHRAKQCGQAGEYCDRGPEPIDEAGGPAGSTHAEGA